ncbi:MAG: ParA family protein [Ostreibacterium sp.]
MNIIAICNQKGGVAKTTTAVNLSASLALLGKTTLLIDLDPQGNATMGCGVDKHNLSHSMLGVCLRKYGLDNAVIKTPFQHLYLAPANQDLTVAEVEMRELDTPPFILREQIKQLKTSRNFDYVIIDCPPALNILTVNAMSAAKKIIVPIQCEYYALEGLTALLNTVSDLQKTVNKDLQVLGFLRTMFDGRALLSRQISAQLEDFLKEKVFSTIVPRNIRLAEAPSHGMPIYYYEKSSKGSKAYQALSEEVINRLK